LVEAGGPDSSPFIHIPPGTLRTFVDPKVNWKFETAPQPHLANRRHYMPRGKTLGGTSSINAMMYQRGHHADYDEWRDAGNPGWGWNDILPYFKKSENNENYTDDPLHGVGGPLNVQYNKRVNPICQTLLEAAASHQYPLVEDFNGPDNHGWGLPQTTIKNGRRCSAAVAYLNPVRGRKNLTIETHAPVSKIVIENGRATGVIYRRHGTEQRVSANHEVLLSAGAVVSPKILMLSGVGDGAALQSHGIETVHHLPGVGKNFQEHFGAMTVYRCTSLVPYGFSIPNIPKLTWEVVRYFATRTGFFSSNFLEAGGFYKTDPDLPRPDIFFAFIPGLRRPPKVFAYGHGFNLTAVLMRPKSTGEIRLASADPDAAPVIDPQCLTKGDDFEILFKGLKEGRRILASPQFAKYNGTEERPGPDVKSDHELREYMVNSAQTLHHPSSCCKMAPPSDPDAVVDARLRVHGLQGLRVIDASIMPTIIGGNLNAPVMAIAEKASDMIKEDQRA
jgi:choline dehydrogenase-like flavoprotein